MKYFQLLHEIIYGEATVEGYKIIHAKILNLLYIIISAGTAIQNRAGRCKHCPRNYGATSQFTCSFSLSTIISLKYVLIGLIDKIKMQNLVDPDVLALLKRFRDDCTHQLNGWQFCSEKESLFDLISVRKVG